MNNKEEHIHPDGGYGWIIILATTVINICVLPFVQHFGLIFQKEFATLGISGAETSFLLHLHSAIYCSLGLLSSPLLKKYDYRQVALLGTTLMSIGILLSSFANSYPALMATISLIGIGQGILLPATYVATNTYFKKRLTLAVSLSVTGVSASSVFMPQFCSRILLTHGRRFTVLCLFAISLLAVASCVLLKPLKKLKKRDEQVLHSLAPPPPVDKFESGKLLENDAVYKGTTLPRRDGGILDAVHGLFNLELLKERPFVVCIVGMAVSFASELNVILMMGFVLPELAHFSLEDVAAASSVQSVADFIGRLIVPLVANYSFKAPPRLMYLASLVISTVGRTALAYFFWSRTAVLFCAVLFGLGKGTKAVYQSVIIPRYVSLERLPAANGLNMLLTGTLSLVIGPVLGGIHDITRTYVYALHAASILSMSCVALWGFDYVFWRATPSAN